MYNSPLLIVILIRHNKNSPWIIYKATESQHEKEVIEHLKYCRKKAKKDMLEEEYKLEYYAPI